MTTPISRCDACYAATNDNYYIRYLSDRYYNYHFWDCYKKGRAEEKVDYSKINIVFPDCECDKKPNKEQFDNLVAKFRVDMEFADREGIEYIFKKKFDEKESKKYAKFHEAVKEFLDEEHIKLANEYGAK